MYLMKSKITAQGRVSIPVKVLRYFGWAPGDVISWGVENDQLVVRKESQYSLHDIQQALGVSGTTRHADTEIRDGVIARTKAKHDRR